MYVSKCRVVKVSRIPCADLHPVGFRLPVRWGRERITNDLNPCAEAQGFDSGPNGQDPREMRDQPLVQGFTFGQRPTWFRREPKGCVARAQARIKDYFTNNTLPSCRGVGK